MHKKQTAKNELGIRNDVLSADRLLQSGFEKRRNGVYSCGDVMLVQVGSHVFDFSCQGLIVRGVKHFSTLQKMIDVAEEKKQDSQRTDIKTRQHVDLMKKNGGL